MTDRNEDIDLSVDEWTSEFYGIYREGAQSRTITELCIKMVRDFAEISTAARRIQLRKVSAGLARIFSDLCIIVGKCQDRSPSRALIIF